MNFIRSILRIIRSVILSLLLIGLVVFMVDNRELITISANPLPFEIQTRVFVVMVSCFILGLVFGVIACSPSITHNFFKHIVDRSKIKKLEKKVDSN